MEQDGSHVLMSSNLTDLSHVNGKALLSNACNFLTPKKVSPFVA